MKLTRTISTAFIMFLIAFAVSCTQQPSADEVMGKIRNGETLESADYETILDYIEEFCNVGEAMDKTSENGRLLGQEYPYFFTFALYMDKAPQEIREQERFSEIKTRFLNLMDR